MGRVRFSRLFAVNERTVERIAVQDSRPRVMSRKSFLPLIPHSCRFFR